MHDEHVFLVSEFASKGSVESYLRSKNVIVSMEMVIRIIYESALGICFLHDHNIVHRDIACRNFLLDSEMHVRVADFGTARILNAEFQSQAAIATTKSRIGPVRWMAPESLTDGEYSFKTDVYMFGIFIWEILHRELPYGAMEIPQIAIKVVSGMRPVINLHQQFPDVIVEIMKQCWEAEANLRPTMDEVCAKLEPLFNKNEDNSSNSLSKDLFFVPNQYVSTESVPQASNLD